MKRISNFKLKNELKHKIRIFNYIYKPLILFSITIEIKEFMENWFSLNTMKIVLKNDKIFHS